MAVLNLKALLHKILSTPLQIDSGTDDIWTYRKWSDGTAECWAYMDGTTQTLYGAVAGYVTFTFPFTFTAVPVAFTSVWVNGDAYCYPCWLDVSTTSASGYLRSTASAGQSFRVRIYVNGRWK